MQISLTLMKSLRADRLPTLDIKSVIRIMSTDGSQMIDHGVCVFVRWESDVQGVARTRKGRAQDNNKYHIASVTRPTMKYAPRPDKHHKELEHLGGTYLEPSEPLAAASSPMPSANVLT